MGVVYKVFRTPSPRFDPVSVNHFTLKFPKYKQADTQEIWGAAVVKQKTSGANYLEYQRKIQF